MNIFRKLFCKKSKNPKVFWIEKGWSEPVGNATMKDIDIAILEIFFMDDEDGAFWALHDETQNALEVHKGLMFFYTYNGSTLEMQLDNWNEVRDYFQLFFDYKFDELENLLRKRA